MAYLCLVFLSTITEASVVSLPVPAVVGMAMSRGIFFLTFKIPFIFESGFPGFASLAPKALAVSMEEPPPMAISESHPSSLYFKRASSTLSVVGFATTSEYTE